MKKFILFSLLFFTTFLYSNNTKEVLLIHSYHKGYIWTNDISNAIEKEFSNYKNIELNTVYMDTKRVSSQKYLDSLVDLYKEQFKNRNFDLILVSDNNAFDFIIKYHEQLFKDVPVLFCGINNFDKALLDENNIKEYMSGVVEQVDLEKNLELISDLHPDLENLIIINDRSSTGLAVKRDLRNLIEKYNKKFNIQYIDNMEISALKSKVANLGENDVILFVLLFKDTTGKYFTYKQGFKQIKEVSKVPIYGLWDFYMDYGIVGGLLTSATAQGQAVSKMAIEILDKNKSIKDIPILEKSPNVFMFDYKELEKHNIDISPFVNNYKLINEPSDAYRQYTQLIVVSVTLILILSIIIIILRGNISRRVKLEKELSNRIEFDKVLLDTIPNPIYYKNTNGKFLGCNLAFSNLVATSKDEVIGKTAYDFFPIEVASKNHKIDNELLETFSTSTSEFTFHTASNNMKHIILNKAVYRNIDGSVGGIVCIMDDITDRIQQKQFLIQQNKLAEMGDMIAAIAHQWNEPLVELSALVQDVETSYFEDEIENYDIKEFVNDSMIQIKYMSRTLNDFRNFLKPSTTKHQFHIKKCLDEIIEIIGKQIFYSNIILEINYLKDEEILIYGYENEFKQVLLNIINNAKNKLVEKNEDSNDKGSIKINIDKDDYQTKIEIVDDGGRINENIIHSIFEPYFTTKVDGTGLGLYMAKVIIEDKMNGTISVKNDNQNVVFTIKLPHRKDK
jgi:PAS domain S-box-containing protein